MPKLVARKVKVTMPIAPVSNEIGGIKTGTWRSIRPELISLRAPCTDQCPARVKIGEVIALALEKRYREAWEKIAEDNPLAAITGRVCYHPCENGCNRGDFDEPIAFHAIERFIGDYALESAVPPEVGKRVKASVAVVGSGPAGLTCSYYLAKWGYGVTVFEALPVSGGMLYVGIPGYRLPREIIEKQIDYMRNMGVEIRNNTRLGRDVTLDDLFQQGYQAVFHLCKAQSLG